MSKGPIKNHGFSLVELIIVVVIMAILAAVIIPQFGDTSGEAKLSTLKATLQTVRSQLELYKVQHLEKYPTLTAWSDAMLKKTKDDGVVDATDGKFGPYLLQMPINPMDNSTTIKDAQDGSGGWAYDETTGSFKANDASISEANSKTKDL